MCVKSQNTLFSLFHLSAIIRCASIARHEIHLTDLKTKYSHTKKSTHTHRYKCHQCVCCPPQKCPRCSILIQTNWQLKYILPMHTPTHTQTESQHIKLKYAAIYEMRKKRIRFLFFYFCFVAFVDINFIFVSICKFRLGAHLQSVGIL